MKILSAQRGFVHILVLLLLLGGLGVGVYLVQQKTNFLPKALTSREPAGGWINGVSAEGYCNSGFQCDLDNTLVNDGKDAGLFYSNTGGQICKINGVNVTSCVTVNLGVVHEVSQAKVAYKMVDSFCGDTCKGEYCGTNPGGAVFSSPDKQNWTKIGTLNYATASATQTFNITSGMTKYLMVCRGGGGGARSNLAVDNISALVSVKPTPKPTPTTVPVPNGEKEAVLALCDGLATDARPYCRQFVEKDYGFNDGRGYTDNYKSYAWGESYILPAYARMYRATRSTLYLDKLVRHADTVLLNRDDKVGRKDYRGISGAGWVGDEKYSAPGKPMRFVVHSGMIISGMVDFARIVYGDEKLWPAYKQKADGYLGAVREVVAAHDAEWKESAGQYYYAQDAPVPEGSGLPVPVNMGAAMGINLFYLYDLTKDQSYLNKATKIAQFLKRNVSLDGTGYIWKYWPEVKEDSEDISHGNIDIRLAKTAYEHGVVFNAVDMKRFADTFTKKVYTGSTANINIHVDGTDSSSNLTWLLAPGRGWIDLNVFSSSIILPIVKRYYDGIDFSRVSFPSGAAGLAALTDLLSDTYR